LSFNGEKLEFYSFYHWYT